MKDLSELISIGKDVALSCGSAKNSAALAAVLMGAGQDPMHLLSDFCNAYDKAEEEKAKAEAEAKAKAEAEAKAKAEAEAKAKAEEEIKANAKELRSLLQAVVERYNDPYPKEDNGYGYIRDSAWEFLSAASDETIFGLFHTPVRRNRWNAAAYRGWEVVMSEDGKECYHKEDGSLPTDDDWYNAFELMVNVPIAYYWQYSLPHSKRVE